MASGGASGQARGGAIAGLIAGRVERLRHRPLQISNAQVYLGILLYCAAFFVLRIAVSPTLGVDDVEQALFSQSIHRGHHIDKPPLYNWLQWILAQPLGLNIVSMMVLKYTVVAATFVLYFEIAKEFIRSRTGAALALISLTLIYVIGYGLHKGYTHTVMLMFSVCAMFLIFMKLRKEQSLKLYVLFGVALGIGLLSKPSFALFAGVFFAAILLSPPRRPVLLTPWILVSLAVAAAIYGPHLHWILTETPGFVGTMRKSIAPEIDGALIPALVARLAAIGKTIGAMVEFLLPFAPLALLFFPVMVRRSGLKEALAERDVRFLALLHGAGIVLLLVAAVIAGLSNLQQRHLHPFLMFAPILFFAAMEARGAGSYFHGVRARAYVGFAAFLSVVVFIAITVSALTPPPDCGKCRLQKPFAEFADRLAEAGITSGTVISGDEFTGGNLAARVNSVRVLSLPYDFWRPAHTAGPRRCTVIWLGEAETAIPGRLARLTAAVRASDVRDFRAEPGARQQTITVPYRLNPAVTMSWQVLDLPPMGDCY